MGTIGARCGGAGLRGQYGTSGRSPSGGRGRHGVGQRGDPGSGAGHWGYSRKKAQAWPQAWGSAQQAGNYGPSRLGTGLSCPKPPGVRGRQTVQVSTKALWAPRANQGTEDRMVRRERREQAGPWASSAPSAHGRCQGCSGRGHPACLARHTAAGGNHELQPERRRPPAWSLRGWFNPGHMQAQGSWAGRAGSWQDEALHWSLGSKASTKSRPSSEWGAGQWR